MVLLTEISSVLKTLLTMSEKPEAKNGAVSDPCWGDADVEPTVVDSQQEFRSSTLVISTEFLHAGTALTAYQAMPLENRPQSFLGNYQAVCIATAYGPSAVAVESPVRDVTSYQDFPSEEGMDSFDNDNWMSRMSCLRLLDRAKSRRRCHASRIPKDTWVFEFPRELCGRLVGRGGRTIQSIMQDSGTYLTLCPERMNPSNQVLKISGTENQILKAVNIIDSKFSSGAKVADSRLLPLVSGQPATEVRQVQIAADREVDVVISTVVNAGHFYLIMPQLAAVGNMHLFEKQMAKCYNMGHVPKLDSAPQPGTYCVAKYDDKWARIQVVSSFARSEKVEAILVDYGTYALFPSSSLRKIRADFLEVPFLASECSLANIIPRNDELFFSMSVTNLFQTLTENRNLKGIARGSKNGVQYVELFVQENNKLWSINRRLVACGAAQWLEM